MEPRGETIRWARGRAGRCVLAIALLVVALVPPAHARGEWYDLYEDALRALEEGKPGNAIELLERALTERKRSGYFRTYGNNYVRYVPHFQLGVAHHDAGECEQALQSFDRSEQANETQKVPAFAAQLRSLRAACEVRLVPPPVLPEPSGLIADRGDERAVALAEPPPPAEQAPPPSPVAGVDPQLLETGLHAYLVGDLNKAVRLFDELVETAPDAARLHLVLGMALHGAWVMGQEQDERLLARSRRALGEAARLNPDLAPDPALYPPRVIALFRSLR